jgi:tRNA-binding EMAP/Myf-like protein
MEKNDDSTNISFLKVDCGEKRRVFCLLCAVPDKEDKKIIIRPFTV